MKRNSNSTSAVVAAVEIKLAVAPPGRVDTAVVRRQDAGTVAVVPVPLSTKNAPSAAAHTADDFDFVSQIELARGAVEADAAAPKPVATSTSWQLKRRRAEADRIKLDTKVVEKSAVTASDVPEGATPGATGVVPKASVPAVNATAASTRTALGAAAPAACETGPKTAVRAKGEAPRGVATTAGPSAAWHDNIDAAVDAKAAGRAAKATDTKSAAAASRAAVAASKAAAAAASEAATAAAAAREVAAAAAAANRAQQPRTALSAKLSEHKIADDDVFDFSAAVVINPQVKTFGSKPSGVVPPSKATSGSSEVTRRAKTEFEKAGGSPRPRVSPLEIVSTSPGAKKPPTKEPLPEEKPRGAAAAVAAEPVAAAKAMDKKPAKRLSRVAPVAAKSTAVLAPAEAPAVPVVSAGHQRKSPAEAVVGVKAADATAAPDVSDDRAHGAAAGAKPISRVAAAAAAWSATAAAQGQSDADAVAETKVLHARCHWSACPTKVESSYAQASKKRSHIDVTTDARPTDDDDIPIAAGVTVDRAGSSSRVTVIRRKMTTGPDATGRAAAKSTSRGNPAPLARALIDSAPAARSAAKPREKPRAAPRPLPSRQSLLSTDIFSEDDEIMNTFTETVPAQEATDLEVGEDDDAVAAVAKADDDADMAASVASVKSAESEYDLTARFPEQVSLVALCVPRRADHTNRWCACRSKTASVQPRGRSTSTTLRTRKMGPKHARS